MDLRAQSIVVSAPRELCFEVVAAAGHRLEKRSEDEWVVGFSARVGDRDVQTTELLTLDRPTAIHYRWLEGPLPDVHESITFVALDEKRTRLDYRGSFSPWPGLAGWAIARVRAKPVFERLVAEHLAQAKQVAEKRARRSKVYGGRGGGR